MSPTTLLGRPAILDAADHHPFARLRVFEAAVGYPGRDALLWTSRHHDRQRIAGLGDPVEVVRLVGVLAAAGRIEAGSVIEVPETDLAALTAALAEGGLTVDRGHYWSILWAVAPPAAEPLDDQVTVLGEADHPAIGAHLDTAFPETPNRPGGPGIRRWFGIRTGAGELAGVAADRSHQDFGYLVAVAVSPPLTGRGFGAALTRRVTRELIAEFGICGLGVMRDNTRARALYRRLGYTGGIDLTSVRLT